MRYKLSDLFELQMGKTPSRNNPNYWNSNDYSWVSISDMSSYDKYVSGTKEYISERAVKESGIKTIPANTVIMSFKLSIGKTAITTGPIFSNEAIMAFIDKKTTAIDPEYIFYLFSGKDWDEGSNKAVMGKTLNKATLSNIEVDIPSLDIQKERIEKLNKISILISDKKQRLNQLDKLIKARFVEMFGDKNFETRPFKDVCDELFAGGDVKKDRTVKEADSDHPYAVFTNGEKDGGLYGYTDIARVIKPSITISGRGTIGFCLVRTEPFYPAIRLIVATPKENLVTPSYLKYFIDSKDYNGRGASIPQLTIPMIKDEPVPIPPIELQNQFETFIAQVDKSKFAVQKSLEKTQLLFDSLMQEYFG